jgi:hypothetical protein
VRFDHFKAPCLFYFFKKFYSPNGVAHLDVRSGEKTMIELVIGVILGGFVSWLVTHIYHKKSSTEIPDWAKPIIDKLPQSQPTESELLELFQEALNSGDIVPDPILGHVA